MNRATDLRTGEPYVTEMSYALCPTTPPLAWRTRSLRTGRILSHHRAYGAPAWEESPWETVGIVATLCLSLLSLALTIIL